MKGGSTLYIFIFIFLLQIQHEVSNGSVVHRLCSDTCFTKFRATKGLKTNCCDNCGIYIYNKGLPLEYLFHEGQQKRFCNAACLNNYKKVSEDVWRRNMRLFVIFTRFGSCSGGLCETMYNIMVVYSLVRWPFFRYIATWLQRELLPGTAD